MRFSLKQSILGILEYHINGFGILLRYVQTLILQEIYFVRYHLSISELKTENLCSINVMRISN